MPTRDIPISVDSIYHVYNRGVNKGLIFFSQRNYQFFIFKLASYMVTKASILAYCLMPNHYHILVKIISSDFVKKGLQPFLISYTNSINQDQNRVGPLFQGRYQANLISDEAGILECVKYIHLNPVKAGLVRHPDEWEHSSFRHYLYHQLNSCVDTNTVLSFFDTVEDFRVFSKLESNPQPKYFRDF